MGSTQTGHGRAPLCIYLMNPISNTAFLLQAPETCDGKTAALLKWSVWISFVSPSSC